MDSVLSCADVLSTFSNLGYKHAEGYHINQCCNEGLQRILQTLEAEDKRYRLFRRSIGFGKHVQRDIIPMLLASREDNTTELLIKILVNLTIPTECIVSLNSSEKPNHDRHMIFEINNLLQSTKSTFRDKNVTKVVLDYLKKNAEQSSNLSEEQITKVISCLQLLRNVLHIPEAARAGLVPPPLWRLRACSEAAATVSSSAASTPDTGSTTAATVSSSALSTSSTLSTLTTVHNQIMWNIFSQSIDKILIKLINIPEAESWCGEMVQLVALMYKDQQDATLHRLLDDWLQIPPSETTDVESNTSSLKKGNEDSTMVVSSIVTSESLDTAGGGNCERQAQGQTRACTSPAVPVRAEPQNDTKNYSQKKPSAKTPENDVTKLSINVYSTNATKKKENANELPTKGTATTTSSNDSDQSPDKQTHEKPLNLKRKPNTNPPGPTSHELRKQKLNRRAKANKLKFQGKFNNTPTDDDITQVLKEFTVDFLLRGFNILVKTLLHQILTNHEEKIDTAHFFWLISYFLKFATQLEMELKQLDSVLSVEIVSYLTAESVNLCEQFQLAIQFDVSERRPQLKRLHLIVAAMREFVQAVDVYNTVQIQLDAEEQPLLDALLQAICEVDELRLVFVLLLRHYNPQHQTREYLQDLVVANHQFIIFLESIIKTPKSKAEVNITAHLKLFATVEMMRQYGLVLENFSSNGRFLNDCVFTLMHHVAGDLQDLRVLYQPGILRTFTKIWENDFVLCADWADLIEHAINTFIRKPVYLNLATTLCWEGSGSKIMRKLKMLNYYSSDTEQNQTEHEKSSDDSVVEDPSNEKWTDEELSSLYWHYVQCEDSSDIVGDIVKLLMEDAVTKSRKSVLNVLHKQNLITKSEFERLPENEGVIRCPKKSIPKEINIDEVASLCDELKEDGRGRFLLWLQKLLLETCFVKLHNEKWRKLIFPKVRASRNENSEKSYNENQQENSNQTDNPDISNIALCKRKKQTSIPLVSPIVGHYLTLQQSVPVVPWNSEQAFICKDLKFLQLMHRLGFQMPVDSGKVFIRVPCIWSAEQLYELAGKVGPIDCSKLKFSVNTVSADRPSLFTRPDRVYPITAPIPSGHQSLSVSRSGPRLKPVRIRTTPYEGGKATEWIDIILRSQKCKIPMDLKRKLVEQCTDENGDECNKEVDEFLASVHKRFKHNHAQAAADPGRFKHNDAQAAAGPGRFKHNDAQAAAGLGRFKHNDAQAAADPGRFKHNDAQAAAGPGRFKHNDAQAAAGLGRFKHNDAQAAAGPGRFKHKDAQAAAGPGRFKHNDAQAAVGPGRFKYNNAQAAAGPGCFKNNDAKAAAGLGRFVHNDAQAAAGPGRFNHNDAQAAADRFQLYCNNAMDCTPRRSPIAHGRENQYGSDTTCDSDDDISFSDSASVTSTRACMNDSDEE